MRKLLLFVMASAMLVGGLYVLVAELFLASKIFVWFVVAAPMLIWLGAYLLWTDFIAAPLPPGETALAAEPIKSAPDNSQILDAYIKLHTGYSGCVIDTSWLPTDKTKMKAFTNLLH